MTRRHWLREWHQRGCWRAQMILLKNWAGLAASAVTVAKAERSEAVAAGTSLRVGGRG